MAQPERQGQSLFFQKVWLHKDTKHLPIFAIPNGGSRNPIEAKNLKRSGVVAGVPDVVCAVPTLAGEHGLWMEAKIGKGKASEKQVEMHSKLRAQGYRVHIVAGKDPLDLANNLWDCLRRYLQLMD